MLLGTHVACSVSRKRKKGTPAWVASPGVAWKERMTRSLLEVYWVAVLVRFRGTVV